MRGGRPKAPEQAEKRHICFATVEADVQAKVSITRCSFANELNPFLEGLVRIPYAASDMSRRESFHGLSQAFRSLDLVTDSNGFQASDFIRSGRLYVRHLLINS